MHTRVQELAPTNGHSDINRLVYESDAIPLRSTNSIDKTSNKIYIFIIANIIKLWLEKINSIVLSYKQTFFSNTEEDYHNPPERRCIAPKFTLQGEE